ncbi:hypothetical protein B7494_g6095 [Chlorociboria aeruginascens]|nr:hypothetical protein B7494_g6095 [Chlorociboria aeruginascens]
MEAPEPGPDISRQWTQYQRRINRNTQTRTCISCPDRRVFASGQDLKTHSEVDHREQLPTDDGDPFAALSVRKKRPHIDPSDLRIPDKVQPDTVSGIGTLNTDTPRRSEDVGIQKRPEDGRASEENRPRRRTSRGSANPFRDSSRPSSPRSLRSRPASDEYESISDLDALLRERQSRPQMGKQLWLPDQNPFTQSSYDYSSNIVSVAVSKARANQLNTKTRKSFQPPPLQSQSPRNSTSQIPQDNQGRPPPTQTETDPYPFMLEAHGIILQPQTRPESQEQLVAKVKGTYAGLVMIEAKCIKVDDKPNSGTQPKLNNEQWQVLLALHRTLLPEYHDFFLASQHPSASLALRGLASKYAMPTRMWRHGIYSFLELLRHRLPASLDYMLALIYLAYSIMTVLYDTVPASADTWIECLGDLGRYRMAIDDDDTRDREVWTSVARHWYSEASDKAQTTGRLYHDLAILAGLGFTSKDNVLMKAHNSTATDVHMKGSSMIAKTTTSRGIKGKVKGHDVWAFGDTGAAQNIISARQAKKLRLKVVKSPRNLRIGNSKTVFSRGLVTFPWAFAESPDKITNVTAHVLDNFKYDILLCRSFLEDTKTMTDHVSRFVKGIFRRLPMMSFNLLGETSHRLNGVLEDAIHEVEGVDCGSELLPMDYEQPPWYIKYGKAATREEWDTELSLRESHELRQYPDWHPDPNRPLIRYGLMAGNEVQNYTPVPLEDSSGHSYNYDMFGVDEAALWQAERPG